MEPRKTANQLYKESGSTLSFKEWLHNKKSNNLDNFEQLVSNVPSNFLEKLSSYKQNKKSYHYKTGTHCYYCDLEFNEIDLRTIDHIYPTSKGGKNNTLNKISCCSSCNMSKSNLTINEFIQKLKQEKEVFLNKNQHKIYQCQKLIPKTFLNWLKFIENEMSLHH